MCNQYGILTPATGLVEEFSHAGIQLFFPDGLTPNLPELPLVRPTDPAPVVTARGEGAAELAMLRWGFPPPAGRKGGPVTNFRSEGRSFGGGRALVPASYFYEFTGAKSPKTRWRFTMPGAPTFCFAALVRGEGETARFTLLTCAPGPDVQPYHDRQIVPLPPAAWRRWLFGPEPESLLAPSPAGTLAVEPD